MCKNRQNIAPDGVLVTTSVNRIRALAVKARPPFDKRLDIGVRIVTVH